MTVAVDLFLRGHMAFKLNVATYDTIRYDNILLNKNHKMSSFKSNENIHKKGDGSYYVVSANKASSVTHFCTSNKIYKYTKSKTMTKTAHSMSYERL